MRDEDLDRDDLKALRETCGRVGPLVTAMLFRQVHLSKSKMDWDVFCNIAGHPHLAACVTELIWYDLPEDHTILRRCPWRSYEFGGYEELNLEPDLCLRAPHELAKLAEDLFWITEDLYDGTRTVELQRLQETFIDSVEKMPQLTSFVARPMPPTYPLSREPYPFTAQLFRRLDIVRGAPSVSYKETKSFPGLRDFMLPAMNRPNSTVRRFQFVDNVLQYPSCCSFEPAAPPNTFDRLVDVNICCTELARPELVHPEGGAPWFHGIAGLERLRISLDAHSTTGGQPYALLRLFGKEPTRIWPALTTLEIVGVSLAFEEAQVPFFKLLAAHAPSLKYLTLLNCGVDAHFIAQLAAAELDLRLSSFRVMDLTGEASEVVSEADLVAFVNGDMGLGEVGEHLGLSAQFITYAEAMPPVMVRRAHGAFAPDRTPVDIPMNIPDSDYDSDEAWPSIREMPIYAKDKARADPDRYRYPTEEEPSSPVANGLPPLKKRCPLWRFSRRNGQTGISDEPLELFSDWDSDSDSGDVAELLQLGDY